jgi:hypothetical protein
VAEHREERRDFAGNNKSSRFLGWNITQERRDKICVINREIIA